MKDNKILDDLFKIRREDFECIIIQKYKKTKIPIKKEKINMELINFIEKITPDKKSQKLFLKKIENFHDCFMMEMEYWSQYYYKFGVMDGVKLDKEIKKQFDLLKK